MAWVLILIAFAPGARAQSRPVALSLADCGRLLGEKPPAEDLRSIADEVVAFISLDHPILTRVLEHSGDLEFLFDLVHLPTGWMLPPPTPRGRAFAQYLLSTRFKESRFAFRKWPTPTKFQRRVADLLARAPDAKSAAQREFVLELVRRSLWMICHLANEEHRERGASRHRDRHFNMSVLHLEPDVPVQAISVDWKRSFTDEDFSRFNDLCYFSREDAVLGEVLRRINAHVHRVVRGQQNLLAALDGVTTPAAFRAARASVVAADDAPRPVPAAPALKERAARTGESFRPERIDAFIAAAAAQYTPAKLAQIDLRRELDRSHEALELVNATLATMSRWRRDDFDWPYYFERFRPTVEFAEALGGALGRFRRGSQAALENYRIAAEALARLKNWSDARSRLLGELTRAAVNGGEVDGADFALASALHAQLPRVSALSAQAVAGFRLQEDLNLAHLAVVSEVATIIGLTLQRTDAGRLIEGNGLRQGLELLARSTDRRSQPDAREPQ